MSDVSSASPTTQHARSDREYPLATTARGEATQSPTVPEMRASRLAFSSLPLWVTPDTDVEASAWADTRRIGAETTDSATRSFGA